MHGKLITFSARIDPLRVMAAPIARIMAITRPSHGAWNTGSIASGSIFFAREARGFAGALSAVAFVVAIRVFYLAYTSRGRVASDAGKDKKGATTSREIARSVLSSLQTEGHRRRG